MSLCLLMLKNDLLVMHLPVHTSNTHPLLLFHLKKPRAIVCQYSNICKTQQSNPTYITSGVLQRLFIVRSYLWVECWAKGGSNTTFTLLTGLYTLHTGVKLMHQQSCLDFTIVIRIKEIYFFINFFNLFVRKGRKKGKVLTYRSHVMN